MARSSADALKADRELERANPRRIALANQISEHGSMEVNIHHAKTNLSKLVAAVENGEEVIIARNGKPAVKLVLVAPSSR